MKIVKNCLLTLLVIAIILSPAFIVLGTVLLTPKVYSESFVGALDEKYELLTTTEGEKIVVVGGSSVAFGLDSEYLSEILYKFATSTRQRYGKSFNLAIPQTG